ncbi:hypothetical protein BKA70DRAFT_1564420 [Coprinopsis sp. MPI-PUGE-AT-0042]|nr:hypothetical protein BKA70DRAFT_1564420 [Coprinopsis sp. MPI-PUGE-AT-0042]
MNNLGLLIAFVNSMMEKPNTRPIGQLIDSLVYLVKTLDTLVSDPRFNLALLKRGYTQKVVSIAHSFQKASSGFPDFACATQMLALITRWPEAVMGHGPNLLVNILQQGVLSTLLDAYESLEWTNGPPPEGVAIGNALFSIVAFAASDRVLCELGKAWDAWIETSKDHRPIWHISFPGKDHFHFFRVMYKFHHALANRPESASMSCSNLMHFKGVKGPSNADVHKPQFCRGCVSTIYCSVACQRVDWERGHKYECTGMLHDHEELAQNAFGMPHRACIRTTALISLWINETKPKFFNKISRLKAQYHPSLPQSEVVYIAKLFMLAGDSNDEVLTVGEYRDRARRLSSYSERRYQRIVAHARSHPNLQLLMFVIPHRCSIWNVLCMATVPVQRNEESVISYGMMQLEYRPLSRRKREPLGLRLLNDLVLPGSRLRSLQRKPGEFPRSLAPFIYFKLMNAWYTL